MVLRQLGQRMSKVLGEKLGGSERRAEIRVGIGRWLRFQLSLGRF